MRMRNWVHRVAGQVAGCLLITGALVLGVTAASGGEAGKAAASRAVAKRVELFEAIAAGQVDVKFIAKDSKQANVLIENKAGEPLDIQLPEAFAAVPIHAQFGGGGFGGGGQGGFGGGGQGGFGGGGGQQQGLGGGFGGGGGGFGGGGGGFGGGGFGGGGGGFFHVAPEKVRKIKVTTVCLEHGKEDPSPRVAYKIVPIDSFTKNPEVVQLCKLVGSGRVNQAAAQAAAWHLANGLSWEELAHKVGVRHLNGTSEPYFLPQQIALAIRISQEAQRRAAHETTPASLAASKADSLSGE